MNKKKDYTQKGITTTLDSKQFMCCNVNAMKGREVKLVCMYL